MEDEVLTGVINHLKPAGLKKWHKRWAALYKRSLHGLPRIELYDSKENFERRDKSGRKHVLVVSLEKCSNIAQDQPGDGAGKKLEFVLRLNFMDEKQQVFSTDTVEDFDKWFNEISSVVFGGEFNSFNDEATFEVEIQESEVTLKLRLQGFYLLYVSGQDIELLDKITKKSIMKWPLHLLRKYGRDKQEFSLEAGRRCPSGPGMFYFKTDQYNAIFQEVENNVKSLASRARAASTSSNTSLAKAGFSNFKLPPEPHRPASPRVAAAASSVYDDPIDLCKDKAAHKTDDNYTYNEPINLQPPPNSRPLPEPASAKDQGKKKKGINFGGLLKPGINGPKKPPRKISSSPNPEMVAEATYAEATGLGNDSNNVGDLTSEYSHLDIGNGAQHIDTEYDSISYPNQWKNSTTPADEDSAYATTGDFPGRYQEANPIADSVYDHVQRT